MRFFSENIGFISSLLVAILLSFITIYFLIHSTSRITYDGIYVYSNKTPSYLNYGIFKLLINLSGNRYESIPYPSKSANTTIGNYIITTLPSFVLKRVNTSYAGLLSLYVFSNVLNMGLNGSYFTLNAPFICLMTGNFSFFSLIYNKTIMTKYVEFYNLPSITAYNHSLAISAFIETNQTPDRNLTIVYANDPFSAVEMDVLDKALSFFGNITFVNRTSFYVPTINYAVELGPVNYLLPTSFSGPFRLNIYNDSLYSLSPSALNELLTYDQNALPGIGIYYMGLLPFVDIGNKYIGFGSILRPNLLNNYSASQILSIGSSNSSIGKVFNSTVYFIASMICNAYNLSTPICRNPNVTVYYPLLN